jgi:alginate O-acetyltransferase complex protein AlgI
MADTSASVSRARQMPVIDVRVANSQTDLRRFAMLTVPLALLLVTFKVYSLEQPAFILLAYMIFGGFAVSYWLPFRFKETFVILLSLAGAWVLLSPIVAGLLILAGLTMFAIVRSGAAFRWKVVALLAILAACIYGRATDRLPVPKEFWPVFGAVFMFRTIVYLYDLKHMRGTASLKDFLSYFFLLPNYYFLLFPVIDFQTFRKSYFKRNIHTVAQQGVWWILRGTIQLLLYRVIYQLQGTFSPPAVSTAVAVMVKVVCSYLLYLRISGQFHIIAGMLCLFGYDLPEMNRRYLLANSINDFWRRVSIYWKDFMVKIFYFPAYFKMRRKGELRAQLLATVLVFLVTWFLHAYQFFWLQGKFHVTYTDSLFWLILGSLVVAEVWYTATHKKRPRETGWAPRVRNALHVAATFTLIAVLWSMWSSNSLTEWFDFLRTGNS